MPGSAAASTRRRGSPERSRPRALPDGGGPRRPDHPVQRQRKGPLGRAQPARRIGVRGWRAAACLYHAPLSDVFLNRQIRDRSAMWGQARPAARRCGANDLAKQDLIVAERERLLREAGRSGDHPGRLRSTATCSRGLDIVEASALATRNRPRAARAKRGRGARPRQDGDGFGLMVASNASSVLCQVTAQDAEAHAAILGASMTDRGRVAGAGRHSDLGRRRVHRGDERGACGAVYAAPRPRCARRGHEPGQTSPTATCRSGSSRPRSLRPGHDRAGQDAHRRAAVQAAARTGGARKKLDQIKANEDGIRRAAQEQALRAQYGEPRTVLRADASAKAARAFATVSSPPPSWISIQGGPALSAQRDDAGSSCRPRPMSSTTARPCTRIARWRPPWPRPGSRCAPDQGRVPGRLLRHGFVNEPSSA